MITLVESRIHGDMYVRFGGEFSETCYSNIVRRWVLSLRLKAQYIWYLGAGVMGLLILFAILYIMGVNSFICLGVVGIAGVFVVMKVYALSNKYGEHGMTKAMARRSLPKMVKAYSRNIYFNSTKDKATAK